MRERGWFGDAPPPRKLTYRRHAGYSVRVIDTATTTRPAVGPLAVLIIIVGLASTADLIAAAVLHTDDVTAPAVLAWQGVTFLIRSVWDGFIALLDGFARRAGLI